MKFYDCQTAPSSRLVRMFIAEKGAQVTPVQVNLRKDEHLTDAFRAINPYCTVPVVETETGHRYTSTQGCWRYLEEQFPNPPLLGSTPDQKARIADLVWRIDIDGFLATAEGLRNKAPGLANRALTGPVNYAQIPELGDRGIARATHFLGTLDRLLDGTDFIAGDHFSAADIAAFVTVDFAKWLKLQVPDTARNTQNWYQRIADRPSAAL